MTLSLKQLFKLLLQVRWDDMEVERHNRVSPWEIEPSSSVSGASLVSPSTKRSRIGFPTTQPDFPVLKGLCFHRKLCFGHFSYYQMHFFLVKN